MSDSLRVLVIDDSEINQQSARQTLVGHDLTIATSYEEGFRILAPLSDDGRYVRRGQKGSRYDVVLTDLLMPASGVMLSPKAKLEHEGKEQALGWALLFRAVLNGCTFVAMASAADHHDHPAAYALEGIDNEPDFWGPNWWNTEDPLTKKPQFVMNGSTVGVFYRAPTVPVPGFPNCVWQCDKGQSNGKTCQMCEGTGFDRGKDWGLILKVLLGQI